MLQRLLVPLDGTPFAEGALPYAEALASRTGAVIHLVRSSLVRHPPLDGTGEQRIVAEERAYLAGIARRLGGKASVTLQHADPADAIVGQARQWGADLIIMATHERGPFGRAIFGSVAKEVLAAAPAPILLIDPDEAPAFTAPHRILLPLDRSPLAEAALPTARLIAAALDAPITLLTALQPEDELTDQQATAYLQEAAARLTSSGIENTIAVRHGHAPEVISTVAAEVGATLIVMATRGHSGLRLMMLGSTAEATLRASNLPLVLVGASSGEREA